MIPVRCESCELPIETREADRSVHGWHLTLDPSGQRVVSSGATIAAVVDITLYGRFHAACVRPRIEALLDLADANGVTA